MINLSDIHLTLASDAGAVNILRGINLKVQDGEALGIIGPSGSGKSTLMMAMSGIERPSSGRISIDGVDLATLDEDGLARLRRERMGIVFQSFHLIPTMTALENVALPRELANDPDAFKLAKAKLEAVGLTHRLTHYPAQLSGGEQQRVALARAFVGSPRILFADEPTGNLDAATGCKVMELLFAMHHDHGTTLILITHDVELAARCDRVVRLVDGQIVSEGEEES
jgi:putative ABC transport system ATP-binding protein